MHTIRRIFEQIIGCYALQQINEMHPPSNKAGVSFPNLLECEPIHQNLDCEIFHVCTKIAGSKHWSLKLLRMDPGVCWAQVNQKVSLGLSVLHVIVLHAMKLYSNRFFK